MAYVDFTGNMLFIENKSHNLDDVRYWLLSNHETLCTNLFVKAIRIKKQSVFTYDWQTIFQIADEAGYLITFHKEQISKQ